ncbi:MAG: tellurite resistance/C4-dicarboxylate transporter family protein [Candidatus Dormibacteria bacterium]
MSSPGPVAVEATTGPGSGDGPVPRQPAPGRFAFVMATGVISLALQADGSKVLSLVFLGLAATGYGELLVAEGGLLLRSPRAFARGLIPIQTALGLFAFATGTEVLASRFAILGFEWPGVLLFCIGGLTAISCAYLVPTLIVLQRAKPSRLERAGGLWLLWPVAFFAVAVAASTLSISVHFESPALAVLAPSLWTVGLVLYLPITALLVGRLLLAAVPLRAVGPSYWITMGAAALGALTAALISTDPATRAQLPAFLPITRAAALGLWFLATALLPMVIGVTVARTLRRDRLGGVQKELWVAAFPAGMYALASLSLAGSTGYAWLLGVGRVAVWAAVAVWVIDLGRGVLLRLLPEG